MWLIDIVLNLGGKVPGENLDVNFIFFFISKTYIQKEASDVSRSYCSSIRKTEFNVPQGARALNPVHYVKR